jgi:drug/metabolite transporter (DMT)-like permease
MDRMGPLLCLLSAAGFGAMAIFGKLAYAAGVEVGDLLLVRFALAAALLLAVAAVTGALRGLPRRSVLAGLGMGAIGYAISRGCTSTRSSGWTPRCSRSSCTCIRRWC